MFFNSISYLELWNVSVSFFSASQRRQFNAIDICTADVIDSVWKF
jgi:hypothetical protein